MIPGSEAPLEKKQFKDSEGFWRPAAAAEPIRGQNIMRAAVHNRELLLHHIRAKGPISRLDLAGLTGLTPPGVFKITKDLLQENWLTYSRTREGLRGQPTSLLSINPDAAFSIGLNIDRDHITFVVLDFGGSVRETFRHDVRFATPAQVKAVFAECFATIVRTHSYAANGLIGIGVSIPDEFSTSDHSTLEAQWRQVSFDTLFADITDLPVFRENDAAAAAIGEMVFGAGLEVDSFFYLYFSFGLGGGLVLNRHYIRGSHGRSGELGYLPQINPFRSSKSALGQWVGRVASLAGLRDALQAAGYGDVAIDQLDLDDQALAAVVEEWTQSAADLLYLPLLTAVCMIDPDAIFLGGHLPAPIVEGLSLEINKRLSMNIGVNWPAHIVRPGKVTSNAAAVGAAVIAFRDRWDSSLLEG
jgi:predicted NBD/HSP70 family sugar kinase